MIKRIAVILSSVFLALFILSVSVLRAATVSYSFYPEKDGENKDSKILGESAVKEVAYILPYAGSILPDSPLWPFKAVRDRIWLTLSTDPSKRAELMLLFADKRLNASRLLFEKGKAEVAYSSLTKSEKYLDQAVKLAKVNSQNGVDTRALYSHLAYASLKHREVIEQIMQIAPEDAKPKIAQTLNYSKNAYRESKITLLSKGLNPPESPFSGE